MNLRITNKIYEIAISLPSGPELLNEKYEQLIIIAEAGVNHNGDFLKGFKLVDLAAKAGADYVKFQTYSQDIVQKIFLAQNIKREIRILKSI